jgi:hypothetical protein
MSGTRWFFFQLSAQPPDVTVDRSRARIALVTPYLVEKLIARDNSSGIVDQISQDHESLARKGNQPPLMVDFHGREIYGHLSELKSAPRTRIRELGPRYI